mmetsp:Transcript_3904/g.7768  ORF Transcript_3904/g.7768 Transcript_3904/m.7768 type:complete len:156 (-) Transcript_3904:155-622(-)|eukprot:scaffold1522_cov166-Amphora_coffeaeformis.AAC.25
MLDQQEKRVRWGHVCVHTHTFRLGCNPGLLEGPPLTIDWARESKEDFPTIEEFNKHYHPNRTCTQCPVYRLTSEKRYQIVAEGSSSEDIEEVEKDIQMIRESRTESANDPPEGSIREILYKKNQERLAKKEKKSHRLALFGSFFRPRRCNCKGPD